jgi:chemotaxis protein methyltransferase CheR
VPLEADIVAGVAHVLAERAGLMLADWIVEARAEACIEALGVEPGDYVERIARGTDELEQLVEAVRVGETRLFRHRRQIGVLVDTIAPQLRGRRQIRVWSAGCAEGQEPYTLAVVLAKTLPTCSISILATDRSARALAAAEHASYPLSDVPEEWRDGFIADGDRVRPRPELAQMVRFQRANVLDPPPERDFDLVWCRNVLIYFTPAARAAAIERVVQATAVGGFVFVGYSESLREVLALEAQRAGEIVYYVKRRTSARALTPMPMPTMRPTPSAGIPAIAAAAPDPELLALAGSPEPAQVTAAITERLAAPGVHRLVIDLDAAELLPDELAPVLRRARAAATAAGTELVLRATRTGAVRWLSRHQLEPL